MAEADNPFAGIVKHVSAERVAELQELARAVETTFIHNGFNVVDLLSDSQQGGALIEVDTVDDEVGGIYVSWRAPQDFRSVVQRYLLAGEPHHEVVEQGKRINRAMHEAIIATLISAGFSVKESEDDMRPLSVVVLERGPGRNNG